jgi:predicted NBD/HSP70 family sugar kinase
VFELIRHRRATTRGEVLEATGLSRMTVAQRIDALLGEGLIVEGPTGPATGGRRPRSLEINADHARVVVASVDTTHTRVGLTDLGGRLLADTQVDVAVESGPDRTLEAIVRAVHRLLTRTPLEGRPVCGMGVSVPGPVDPATRRPSQPPIMPGWDDYPVAERLETEFPGVPVTVANDADVAALGEQRAAFPDVRALCMVKVSTGLGSGIVIDGRVYRGADGGAGDIGHVRLHHDVDDAVCLCGAVGCLAAVASGRAVARRLSEMGVPALSGRDVRALLSQGNGDAARLTQQAGRLIGEVMATGVCVLNPEVVVVGGDLASPPLLAGIGESLHRLSLPRATRHLSLRLGTTGDDAPLIGLSRTVVDEQFSVDAVNERFR